MTAGKPKKSTPPALPPAAAAPSEIASQAQRAGAAEGRRLRRKTGRLATRKAQPNLAGVPADIGIAGLKTSLG